MVMRKCCAALRKVPIYDATRKLMSANPAVLRKWTCLYKGVNVISVFRSSIIYIIDHKPGVSYRSIIATEFTSTATSTFAA